jgi:hypothetical protein
VLLALAAVAPLGAADDIDTADAGRATVSRAFTYQGVLESGVAPVDGTCDFRFDLWDAAEDGTQLGSVDDHLGVDVNDGRFAVTVNRSNVFGTDAFTGQAHWLRIQVRCPAGSGSYVELTPRQELTLAPYAQSLRPGATISGSVSTGVFNIYSDWIGVYVGQANSDGFFLQDAVFDGFQVQAAGDNGLEVRGAADYAGWFDGDIYVSGACSGCRIASFAVNTGASSLEAGDVVTTRGVRSDTTSADDVVRLIEIERAAEGDSVVGVVAGRAELDTDDESEAGPAGLVPREGPAAPGEYVTIVTHGVMQVTVDAASRAIAPGDRLTVGADGGVRTLRTVMIDGITLSESAPSVGIALESPDRAASADGIWVLVNPH